MKFQRVSPFDIEEFESWLSYNAQKGWFLYDYGRCFCWFKKGEPQKMEYRVDISIECFSEEKRQLYEEAGWDFVVDFEDTYIFSSPSERKVVEIYTDINDLKQKISKLAYKNLKISILIILGIVVVSVLTTLFLKTPNAIPIPIISIPIISYAIFGFARFKTLNSVKKDLLKNNKINHHKEWKGKKSLIIILPIVLLVLYIILCIIASLLLT